MKQLFFLFISFLFTTALIAQPANDDCINATPITLQPMGTSCATPLAATTVAATASVNPPSCGVAAQLDDDVWFSFTANSNSIIVRITGATLVPSGSPSVSMALYESACPAGSASFFCANAFAFINGNQIVNGLAIDSVYFLRIWNTSSTSKMNFNICVQSVPAAPVNDECVNAANMPVTPFGINCSSPTVINTAGATASANPPACANASHVNDDVWYSFTATSASHIFKFTGITDLVNGGAQYAGFAVYNSCPASNASFHCTAFTGNGSGYKIVDGLTIGNIYYVRLWSYDPNNYVSFNFCIQDVPAPPANDECANAINVGVTPFAIACSGTTAVTTLGATASANPPTCASASHVNDDVWYTFTATSASHIFKFSGITDLTVGGSQYAGFAVYNSCPTSAASVHCTAFTGNGSGYKIVDGLTIGNLYYLRVWTYEANNYGSFNFCIQEVAAPPANDECANAINVGVTPFALTCSGTTAVTTLGATASANPPTCASASHVNDDVWYTFTATSASHIFKFSGITDLTVGGSQYAGFAVYNSCPTSTASVHCTAFTGNGSGYKIVDGFTIGNIYYLRFWSYEANNYASFNFCIQELPPTPSNDECTNPINVSVTPFGVNCTGTVVATTMSATPSSQPPTCASVSNVNDDVWYTFTATSASHIFRFTGITDLTSGGNEFAGFALYNACPASTASVHCTEFVGAGNGFKIVDGLTIGNVYYLRIWSYNINNYISFNFCIQQVAPPPANNECVNAINIISGPPTANCISPIFVSTAGATPSANPPSCATVSHVNDDVWFSFTATSTSHKIVVTNAVSLTNSGNANIGYALYNSCPTTTASVSCNQAFGNGGGSVFLNALTVGNTYYLRLWTFDLNNYGSFNFCLLEAPLNNECTGAVNVPVTNGFCSQPISGTLSTASVSAGFGAPSCNPSALGNDVWYKTTVPATGNLIIQTSAVNTTVTNLVLQAYTGACGSLTSIACDDDSNPETSPSANHARIVFTGRAPGEVIYYRVMPFNSSNLGDFVICAWDTTSPVLPAVSPGGACVSTTTHDISSVSQNRYFWVPIMDNTNRIIAEVYADASNIGTLNHSLNFNSGAIRNHSGKFYLDRNLSLYGNVSTPVKIRIYYTNAELAALQAADGTANSNNLQVVKSSDSCSNGFGISPTVIIPTNYVSYGSNYYVQFTTSSLSTFYLESKCPQTITWTGNVSTDWHDPANWDCSGVPWIFTNVTIPSGRPRYPVVSVNAEIKRLTVQSGATVTVNTGIDLKVNGQ